MKPEEALTWRGDGGANVTKRKSDHPQTEMEITPETREPLEEFTQEEIDSGVIATGRPPVQGTDEGIEKGLFEDLKESIREAGAILRGEREAARRTRTLVTRPERTADARVVPTRTKPTCSALKPNAIRTSGGGGR